MSQAPSMPVFVDAMIGDTLHLTTEEFGAYHFILYATWRNNGRPLENDDIVLARVCRLSQKNWQKIRPIIVRFFDITDGTWRQGRLEREWTYVSERAERAKANGLGGGRPKRTQDKPNGLSVGSVSGNPDGNLNESPHTHTQSQKKERSPNGDPKKNHGSRLTKDWWPGDADIEFAENLRLPESTADEFRDYWIAKPGKDGVKLDWSATWRNWCRRAAKSPPRLGLVRVAANPNRIVTDSNGMARWKG